MVKISDVVIDYPNDFRFPGMTWPKEAINQVIQDSIDNYGVYGTTAITFPLLSANFSHKLNKIGIKENAIKGEFETLNTPAGLALEAYVLGGGQLIGHINFYYDISVINNGLNGIHHIWSIDLLRV